jgi:hypothetical protein
MVVAVAVVRMMQVAGDYVVRVPRVRYRFMAAAGAVFVSALVLATLVLGGAAVGMLRVRGQLVVIHMIVMHVVHVTLMQIVRVPLVFDARMPASGTVSMRVAFVTLAIHNSSR